ncbi:Eukaryotic translation initiation factor 3 subunit I [Microtus ochrogaster]|uniref:Eukaryotic translation initiation factor 3 subunit I n=1 Tax=Microtus ochrogaster TaxID=79684 RepID=A0A8J6GFL9_MICOH|nr:Eukaryotic translation initiation factor 3 subunit I [Microtus ochrogaster]
MTVSSAPSRLIQCLPTAVFLGILPSLRPRSRSRSRSLRCADLEGKALALSSSYGAVKGGGQEAMDVTVSSTRIDKFEATFFLMAFEEEFGRVKGHFRPINSVAFHPHGKSYSSVGEDGYTSICYFGPQFFEFEA